MSDRKKMKDAVNLKVFMEVLKSMSEDEFEDYIVELEDMYYTLHPESKEDIYLLGE